MRTGVSYMGHHNPKHIETDIREMKEMRLDDVLVAAQENDFVYFTGKIEFTPRIAKEHGIRPIAIFWGALNVFGGGASSQFLLSHPEGFQVTIDGSHASRGCYVNPICVQQIQRMIDRISELGFQGYFVDEPSPLQCYCGSCCGRFREWYGGDLKEASAESQARFRKRCVVDYVTTISGYCKKNHPHIETSCCIMPRDRAAWNETAAIPTLDSLGTDIYLVNEGCDVGTEMQPLIDEMAAVCRKHKKLHHEWLQSWTVRKGNEHRILEHGKVLVRSRPDALYVWAWQGQVGTTESCDDPALAWEQTRKVLALAKEN